MKSRNLIALLFIFMIGCSPKQYDNNHIYMPSIIQPRTVIIDSCEYIEYQIDNVPGRPTAITHKGNCKYCKQRLYKTLLELKNG